MLNPNEANYATYVAKVASTCKPAGYYLLAQSPDNLQPFVLLVLNVNAYMLAFDAWPIS